MPKREGGRKPTVPRPALPAARGPGADHVGGEARPQPRGRAGHPPHTVGGFESACAAEGPEAPANAMTGGSVGSRVGGRYHPDGIRTSSAFTPDGLAAWIERDEPDVPYVLVRRIGH